MEAKVNQQGEILIIHLKGQLDFESADAFKETCLKHLGDSKIIFNLKELNFVGSSGITPFMDTMVQLKGRNGIGMKFCGVSIEFLRVFQSNDIQAFEIYEDEAKALYAFHNPMPQTFIANEQVIESSVDIQVSFTDPAKED